MVIQIAVCPIGVFAVEDGKIVSKKLFRRDAIYVVSQMDKWESGKEINEVDEIRKELAGKDVVFDEPNDATKFLEDNMRNVAMDSDFSSEDFNKLLVEVGNARSSKDIKSTEKRDKLIIQAVSALSDMDKILNLMTERLREWYGLHYPEFDPSNHERFAESVAKFGLRENFDNFKSSVGMDLSEEDVEILKVYGYDLKKNYELRKLLEDYLIKAVPTEIPNVNALLGPVLSARLLSHAGTLEKLAKMPSSKIQLLGSEKSMFRFLKDKRRGDKRARPPRFGILFTHPAISSSAREKQGKIARLLSASLTIAARADFYSKENHGEELKREFEKKLSKMGV